MREPFDAFFQRYLGLEACHGLESMGVGAGFPNIARWRGEMLDSCLFAQLEGEQVQEQFDFDGILPADVEGSPGSRRASWIGGGVRSSDWRSGGYAPNGLDRIVDVGEIPAHGALGEQLKGLVALQGLGKEEWRHVGTSPRAVNREKPQACAGQSEQMRIAVGHQLARTLGGRVQACGMVGASRFQKGGWIEPVDGAAAGEKEVGHPGLPAIFQDVNHPLEVALDVIVGMVDRMPNPGLGSQVEYALESGGLEDFLQSFAIGDVHGKKPEAREALEDSKSGGFPPRIVGIIEIVDADHLKTFVQEAVGEMKSDETGAAGHQDAFSGEGQTGCFHTESKGATGSIAGMLRFSPHFMSQIDRSDNDLRPLPLTDRIWESKFRPFLFSEGPS